MTWKFPGAGGEGNAMDDALASVGLWNEREAIAKRLYEASVHHNSFSPWSDLNEPNRKPWLKKAEAEMRAPSGAQGASTP